MCQRSVTLRLLRFNGLLVPKLVAAVLQFPLPDALISNNGEPVRDVDTWTRERRPEILAAFADQVYGKTPTTVIEATAAITSIDGAALNGKSDPQTDHAYLPSQLTQPSDPHPSLRSRRHKGSSTGYCGLNFFGNQTVDADPGITLPNVWPADANDAEQVRARRRHI